MTDVVTTLLELLGLLLLVVAAAVAVAPYSLAGAIAVAGVGLIVTSAVVTALNRGSHAQEDAT